MAVYKNLDGTTKDEFSLGKQNKVKVRNNSGVFEIMNPSQQWVPITWIGQDVSPGADVQFNSMVFPSGVQVSKFSNSLEDNDNSSVWTTATTIAYIGQSTNETFYAVEDAESSTTSTTPQQKLRLSFTPSSIGNYEVNFSYMYSASNPAVKFTVIMECDDSVRKKTLATKVGDIYTVGDYQIGGGNFVLENLSAEPHTIDMDYAILTGSGTLYIKEATIVVRRL